MKLLHTQIICTLICLTPTIVAGQALHAQKQLLPSPLFQGTSHLNARQMTDTPLLRLSNTGPMGEDGIKLELTSLPLLDPGPSILMDLPDPMDPGSGAIRFQPNSTGSELSIYDSGTSGIGTTLGYAGFPNYYDVIYDMNGFCQTSFNNLHCTNTFVPDTGKYVFKITSADPDFSDHVFLSSYQLSPLEMEHKGDNMIETVIFKSETSQLERKTTTTNPPYTDRVHKVEVDLATKKVKESLQDLSILKTFDEATPNLEMKIQSSDTAYLNSFFDINYNLDIGSIVVKHKNWQHGEQYNESDWNFITSLSSNDPGIPGFFDITYDISLANSLKHWTRSGGTGNPPLEMRYEYDAIGRKIKEVNTDFQDGSFFDITYDFPLQRIKTECNNLVCTGIYSNSTSHEIMYSSNEPSIPSFFDITYEIALPGLQKHSTKAGATGGMMPLELRYEYDALSRKIRNIYTDLEDGSTVTFEQRFGPGEPTHRVGCRLEMATGKSIISQSGALKLDASVDVTGTMSSSSGPLSIGDDLVVNGVSHMINGNLTLVGPTNQVNGNLHVNGTLTATNKMFKIDHPLDPDNKYLVHSCVESPDMMNIYNGNVMTDDDGFATIQLPDYFEALNTDFRYQLTCIGQFAQAIIAEKISNNQFTIQTDKPHVEVSWQVTGVRHDPGAKQSGFKVEEEKEANMKGKRMYAVQ